MDHEQISLAATDLVTVFLGADQTAPKEFKTHPQLHWVPTRDDEGHDLPLGSLEGKIPDHTRLILLTDGIKHSLYHHVTAEARRLRAMYLHKKSAQALTTFLWDLFPTGRPAQLAPGEVAATMPHRGKVIALINECQVDPHKSTADEARRLQQIAHERGIITTFGSISQGISVWKRKMSLGEIPASARRRDIRAESIQVLDDAIAGLTLMREFIVQTTEENTKLRKQVAKLKDVLAGE
jgi:hypothetical protein